MSTNLVIVALPEEQDRVWKVSSEKAPHLTLLFLGDAASNPNTEQIIEFVQHAVEVSEHGEFMLDVDRRDTLGADEADVLFFRKDWSAKWIRSFREQLLQNTAIKTAYDSTEQFPEWQPHLTLGYPETPAKEDDSDYGISFVSFDRIAVWTEDFDGPTFRLRWPDRDPEWESPLVYSATVAQGQKAVDALLRPADTAELGAKFLAHYGVKGMKWGVRQASAVTTQEHIDSGLARRQTKITAKGGEAAPAHTDAVKAAVAKQVIKKSGTNALSTQELRDLANRLQVEAQVKTLMSSKGQQFVQQQIKSEGQQQLRRGGAKIKRHVVKKATKGVATAATVAALG